MARTSLYDHYLRAAQRLARRPLVLLLVAGLLTALAVREARSLRFTSDLTQLLPDKHPALVTLRKIQGKSAGETAFMVLLSRAYLFAVDAEGAVHLHDSNRWHRQKIGPPLAGLGGVSPTEVYAVGEGGFIARYDGKTWQPRSSGTRMALKAVWAGQSGEAWAVGDGGTVLALRGGQWHAEAAPKVALYAVAGRDPAQAEREGAQRLATSAPYYAVGARRTVLHRQPSGTWHVDPLVGVAPGRGAGALFGVWVSRQGEVHAVGEGGLWLRKDGRGRWATLATGSHQTLRTVFGFGDQEVYAAGDGGALLRYDGKTVAPVPSTTKSNLYAMHGVEKDKLWVAGDACALRRYQPTLAEGTLDMRPSPDDAYETKPAEQVLFPFLHKPPAPCRAPLRGLWRPPNVLAGAKQAARDLVARYAKSPLVGRLSFQKPVAYFKHRALYYLDVGDLVELEGEVRERFEKEVMKTSGLGLGLDEDDDDGAKSPGAASKPSGTATTRPTSSSAASRPAAPKKQESTDARLARHTRRYGHLLGDRADDPFYVHPDGATVGIVVYSKPATGLNGLRALRSELWRIARAAKLTRFDPLLQIDIGGDGENKIREYEATIQDIVGLVWLAIGGILLLLIVYFRRLVGVIFVVVPLAMSIAWTFAVTDLTIGTLNVVTGFLFAVLFGLGIDYGLQLYGRYREAREAGETHTAALEVMLFDTGKATLTSALTSSAALLTLTITDFKGFSEFGFIAGLGVICALMAFLTVLPALIDLAERLHLLRIVPKAAMQAGVAKPILATRFRGPVLALTVVGVAVGAYGLLHVEFEYDNSVLRPNRGHNYIQYRANHVLGGSFTPTQLVAKDPAHLRAALAAIERERLRRGSKQSTVKSSTSILALVPERQHEKQVILARLDALLSKRGWKHLSLQRRRELRLDELRDAAKARPFTVAELPPSVRRGFRGPGFGDNWVGLVAYQINISDTREARRFKAEVGHFEGMPLVNVGSLLPAGARAFVDGQRVEIACAGASTSCLATARQRFVALKHDGRAVFAQVASSAEAVRRGLAVEGGLRGQLLAITAVGFVPRSDRAATPLTASGTFHVSSSEVVLTEVVEVMLHDSRIALGLALAAVFLVCLLDFRSFRLALLACLPLAVGMVWIMGALWIFSLRLNMFNFVVLPVLVGIGIDYGVHFVHRYNSEGAERLDWVGRQLRWVLLFCAATTIVGFGNMALAQHPGLQSLGVLSVIGLIAMLLASTVSLPAFLSWLGRKR